MTSTAPHACFSCADKKRRCDRALPACSYCLRQNRKCWYRVPELPPTEVLVPVPVDIQQYQQICHPIYTDEATEAGHQIDRSVFQPRMISQPGTPPHHTQEIRLINACLRCQSQKKKCDRAVPECASCKRNRTSCIYLRRGSTSYSRASFLYSLDTRVVTATTPLPITPQPHMPMLINSFIKTFGMNPLPVDNNSLAQLLRVSWIQQALSDPCLFHATLYAASAHLDALRGSLKSNQMTIYHHMMTLRLLNEKLTAPNGILEETILACIAPLVFFASITGDKNASQAHKRALTALIKAHGGLEHLAIGPFLTALVAVCVLTEAIIHDSELVNIPFLLEIPPTPPTPPISLFSAILQRVVGKSGCYNLSPDTIRIFEDLHFYTRYLADPIFQDLASRPLLELIESKWQLELEESLMTQPLDNFRNVDKLGQNAIYQSCHAAALIFWYLVGDFLPFSASSLQFLVKRLQHAMLGGCMDTWVKSAPEAHSFVCLVGSAASADVSDRVWFSLRHGQPVICIQSQGASIFLECWMLYDCLNRRRKSRIPTEVVEQYVPPEANSYNPHAV